MNYKIFGIIALLLFVLLYLIANKWCWPFWGLCQPGESCPPQSVVNAHRECLTSVFVYGFIPVLIIAYLLVLIYEKVRK